MFNTFSGAATICIIVLWIALSAVAMIISHNIGKLENRIHELETQLEDVKCTVSEHHNAICDNADDISSVSETSRIHGDEIRGLRGTLDKTLDIVVQGFSTSGSAFDSYTKAIEMLRDGQESINESLDKINELVKGLEDEFDRLKGLKAIEF